MSAGVQETLSISTPEGVSLELPLAGLGSRFVALLFAYPVAFELGAGGRTPGKRWSNLRVVSDDGSPVTFRGSALRNVLRLVDILPALYLVGTIAIFATRNNQRLGDLAAGTLVVREPREAAVVSHAPVEVAEPGELPAWDVSGLREAELVALRRFLERRDALDAAPRNLLARDLAKRLRPSVGGVGGDLPPERFLELIAALRRIRT